MVTGEMEQKAQADTRFKGTALAVGIVAVVVGGSLAALPAAAGEGGDVITSSVMVGETETAIAGYSDCTGVEALCVWEDSNFGGDMYWENIAIPDWQYNRYNLPNVSGWAVRNDDSSYYSKWTVPVRIYRDHSYGNPYHCLIPGQLMPTVSPDDDGESHKWNGNNC